MVNTRRHLQHQSHSKNNGFSLVPAKGTDERLERPGAQGPAGGEIWSALSRVFVPLSLLITDCNTVNLRPVSHLCLSRTPNHLKTNYNSVYKPWLSDLKPTTVSLPFPTAIIPSSMPTCPVTLWGSSCVTRLLPDGLYPPRIEWATWAHTERCQRMYHLTGRAVVP